MRWRSVLVLSAILIAGISIGIGLRVLRLEKLNSTLQWVVPAPDFRAGRAIFLYSVIPGGVRDQEELRQSILRDPVVAEHYRDIRPAVMFPMRLAIDTDGYVSYRIGHRVFWTRHLVRIKKGELVLTDGHSMIRGRCGNQIVPAYLRPSATPTTLDPAEPPPLVFEAGYPPVMSVPPHQALLAEKRMPAIPTAPAAPGAGSPPGYWPPIPPPVAWCCSGSTNTGVPPATPPGGGGSGGGGETPTPQTVPPTTPSTPEVPASPVPEPTTLFLVGTGLAAMKLFGSKRR